MPRIQEVSGQVSAKACVCNSSIWEAEAGRAPHIWELSELHRDTLSQPKSKTSVQNFFIWKSMTFA